jgi:hypothetical protein
MCNYQRSLAGRVIRANQASSTEEYLLRKHKARRFLSSGFPFLLVSAAAFRACSSAHLVASILTRRIALPLLLLVGGLVFVLPVLGHPSAFDNTGSLNTTRSLHTATLLPNGKVLVAGGNDQNNFLQTAELYDPATGSWTATGNLNTARYYHTATLLPNGKVLVAGGGGYSAELYDPGSGSWTATGNLNTARDQHTATLLPNGKVLVAGGYSGHGPSASAELYDPGSGSWTATGDLNTARLDHTATLLPNGKVLVTGGRDSNNNPSQSAELYDPGSGSWTATGNLNTFHDFHTATLLPNGKVLVAGQDNGVGAGDDSAELYDPATGSWTTTGNLNTARVLHRATLLPNGKVLVAGGLTVSGVLASAELYDPASGSWSATGNLNTARERHTATLLPNGKVLMAGGNDSSGKPLASAELYEPPSGASTPTPTPASKLLNISTRMEVQNGNNVLIGGFIVTGTDAKKVMIRALGPTLPVSRALADPVLELHNKSGAIATNDNWKINDATGRSQESIIRATTIPPSSDLESAIIATLPANNSNYTAIVRGKSGGTGVGQVEVYDLGQAANSQLANISTRGFVDTGDNVMIGGLIAGPNTSGSSRVLVRAIGPSLPVSGALQDPVLELHNANGSMIASNDNWKTNAQSGHSQEADIRATAVAPTNDLESALLQTVAPGNYTAIVRGKNNKTGIGLVEVYNLQ